MRRIPLACPGHFRYHSRVVHDHIQEARLSSHVRWNEFIALFVLLAAVSPSSAASHVGGKPLPIPPLQTDPAKTAKTLAAADVWLMPQPKSVAITNERFDLKKCKGIRLVGCDDVRLKTDFPALLAERCGVRLKASAGKAQPGLISFVLAGVSGFPFREAPLKSRNTGGEAPLRSRNTGVGDLGDEGYQLRVDHSGVTATATTETGLYYASRTIAQLAAGRTQLPGIVIRDWPALRWRGIQYDISRGQMPKLDALKRLMRVAAEAKTNTFELYIEHVFHWRRHPDIAPPEALTAEDARKLCDLGDRFHTEVHPMMQTFGHFYNIGTKPQYKQFMVPDGGTVDIRKPDAVAFVMDLIDEICEAFPGKFLNVDITEINDAAFKETGMTQQQLTELTLQYALKIRDTAARRGKRLMIVQGPLGAEGTLTGLGSVVERLPKDVLITSYYTAEFYSSWEKDFPRLKQLGLEFLAQPWIDSHGHIMPYVGHAMDFSDITISRGLQHGAVGSVTCDWGDDGHYHLPGMTWYPFLYHAASAWTGAKLDRAYFDKAFCRLIFGAKDDSIARAIQLAGNINGQSIRLRNASGGIDEPPYIGNSRYGRYYYEFFADPFTDPKILDIVEPGKKGREILEPAQEAVKLLERARRKATRNKDVLEQLLFAAKNYEAMGRKLIIRERFLDESIPRSDVASELLSLVKTYEALKADFTRLWLADCKDAGSFQGYLQRFDNTIAPCRQKAEELAKAKPGG